MLVHIFELDDVQHDHGPWSPEARATMEAIDRELGALLGGLDRSAEWKRTTLVVVLDHGFAPVDHEIRLGVLFARHGWCAATGMVRWSRPTSGRSRAAAVRWSTCSTRSAARRPSLRSARSAWA